MPVRPRRQRRGIAPLSMTDEVSLTIGPLWEGALTPVERDRLTLVLRQHRAEFHADSWGVRHLLDGVPLPAPQPVAMTAEAVGMPGTG